MKKSKDILIVMSISLSLRRMTGSGVEFEGNSGKKMHSVQRRVSVTIYGYQVMGFLYPSKPPSPDLTQATACKHPRLSS
jgi:hypothetical protein